MITDACKYHGRKVEALLKRGARERERERDSFSRLDAFYTIGVIGGASVLVSSHSRK